MPTISQRKQAISNFTSEIPSHVLAPTTPPFFESQSLIPVQKIHSSSITITWKHRINRQVYLLANGTHTEQDLARLLHKPLLTIRHSLGLLFCTHTIDIMFKQQNAPLMALNPLVLQETLECIAPKKENNQFLEVHYQERKQEFAELFYARLRAQSEKIDAIFLRKDIHEQGNYFHEMLWLLIEGIQRSDTNLSRNIQELGQRHRRYGVRAWMYPVIGITLLESFEQFLGTAWTPLAQENWMAFYTLVSGVLLTTETL